jgi:hypothetical protein
MVKKMSDLREQLRKDLIESYRHRAAGDAACALCGNTTRPLAFHMLEASFSEGNQTPDGFVPMSASRGRVSGSFPICNVCSPPCKKCGLPVPTEKVLELGYRLKARSGNGVCQHIQFGLFLSAILKRLFGIGRFGRRAS